MKMVYLQALRISRGPADCNIRSACDTANIIYTSSNLTLQTARLVRQDVRRAGPRRHEVGVSVPPRGMLLCLAGGLLFQAGDDTKARDQKRIGLPLPYDPSRPVNTFWDIGMDDENCIWFHQTDGVRHRLIDFYSNSGSSNKAVNLN